MQYMGDTKAGTLIGKDKFGNTFYENLAEELPCTSLTALPRPVRGILIVQLYSYLPRTGANHQQYGPAGSTTKTRNSIPPKSSLAGMPGCRT
jgi:hypothetical protein